MGHLRVKANECKYEERDRRLKTIQFINGINDDMMTEIIRELSVIKKTNEKTSEQVLSWTRRVEEQRAQKLY